MIYLTSDAHRDFEYIKEFVRKEKTSNKDFLIVTGDAQINYFENEEDALIKKELAALSITFIFIQGNKEKRPNRIPTYKRVMNSVGYFYIEDEFPNLWFAEDGQILNIVDKSFLVLGGAYSVYAPGKKDGKFWWEDEQMSPVLKDRTLELIKDKNNKIDYILSHTAPLSKIPDMGWIKDIDKSKLDLSFEKWLDELDKLIEYKKWFIGHYHINHVNQKYNYVYKELIVID